MRAGIISRSINRRAYRRAVTVNVPLNRKCVVPSLRTISENAGGLKYVLCTLRVLITTQTRGIIGLTD
jgi:hypothetical protein